MVDGVVGRRQVLGQSVVEMLLAGVSTRWVGQLLERIIDLPVAEPQLGREVRRVFPSIKRIQRHEKGLRPYYYSGLTYQWGEGKFVRR